MEQPTNLWAASLYLMLSGNLIRFIFGLALATNAVNLLIFVAGRLSQTHPPLIDPDAGVAAQPLANALPQALILTAIVIGFALLTFVFILFYKAYQSLNTVETELMRVSEPRENSGAEEGGQAGIGGAHGPGREGA
ncbi:MAG: NADH-quinone oxidoreductase subunit K [Desulfosalsimonas sp.]|uniref:NADH-quinone oxidoreductase subunit K n=1 Tax=Desulfosalsimonas sp. TaxID=3073848 RepID=UPI0039708DDF